MTRLVLLGLLLTLAACQSREPTVDYDPTRNFSAYRSWSWHSPAVRYRPEDPRLQSDLTDQRIREAVAEALDQRGLRPAPPGSEGDLQVQAWLVVDERQQQVITQHGGPWLHPYYGSLWGGPAFYEARTMDYQVATLQIDLHDANDDKLVWRGSTSWVKSDAPRRPSEHASLYRERARQALSGYPPQ